MTAQVDDSHGTPLDQATIGADEPDPVPVTALFAGATNNLGSQVTPRPSGAGGTNLAGQATFLAIDESSANLDVWAVVTDPSLRLQDGSGSILPDTDQTVDIVLQPWPTVVPKATSITPVTGGTTVAQVPVALSAPSTQTVTVGWQTYPGPGTAPAADYTAASGTVTFAPGQTAASAPIVIKGNSTRSPETVVVSFNSPVDSVLGGFYGLGVVTIHPVPSVVPSVATVTASTGGSVVLPVPVTLSQASTQTVTASWTTEVLIDQPRPTQAPTSDYVAASGTVTFAPGQTSATVPITVTGDSLGVQEYVVLAFSAPTNASIGGLWGLGVGFIDPPS